MYENMRDINKAIKMEFVKYIEKTESLQENNNILTSIFKRRTITKKRNED